VGKWSATPVFQAKSLPIVWACQKDLQICKSQTFSLRAKKSVINEMHDFESTLIDEL
jgi:hypothetical protein